MRTLAISKVDVRSLLRALRLTLVGLCCSFFCGCTTQNDPSDLSAFEWEAKTVTQDGKSTDLAEQKPQLRLLRNGAMRLTTGTGSKRRTLEGSYELASGNQVVLHLKDETEGSKTHVAELILSKDSKGTPTKLVFKDSQGTIEFEPKK